MKRDRSTHLGRTINSIVVMCSRYIKLARSILDLVDFVDVVCNILFCETLRFTCEH